MESKVPFYPQSFMFTFLLCLIFLPACQIWESRPSFVKLESPASSQVLQDLNVIRKLHNPPETVVTIKEKTSKADLGRCHGPACVVLLIPLTVDRLFPNTYFDVKIVEKGRLTYWGSFGSDETFSSAFLFHDGLKNVFQKFHLPEIGKQFVLRTDTGKENADWDELTPVGFGGQLDIHALYAEELAKSDDTKRHAAILEEAFETFKFNPSFKSEVEVLITKFWSDTGESEEGKQILIQALCKDTVRTSDYDWLKSLHPEWLALNYDALECLLYHNSSVPHEALKPLLAPSVRHICDSQKEDRVNIVLNNLVGLPYGTPSTSEYEDWKNTVKGHFQNCSSPSIAAMAQSFFYQLENK